MVKVAKLYIWIKENDSVKIFSPFWPVWHIFATQALSQLLISRVSAVKLMDDGKRISEQPSNLSRGERMLLVRVQVLEGLLTSQPSGHVWKGQGLFFPSTQLVGMKIALPGIMQVMQQNTWFATDTKNFWLCEHLLCLYCAGQTEMCVKTASTIEIISTAPSFTIHSSTLHHCSTTGGCTRAVVAW